MTVKKIIKHLRENILWSEECPLVHQTCEWAWHGFTESSRYFDKKYLTFTVGIYKDGFGFEETSREEKYKQFGFLLKRYKKDNKYIEKKIKKWKTIAKPLVKNSWKFIKEMDKLSMQELASGYKRLTEVYNEQARYSIFYECVDPFTEDELPKLLQKELPDVTQRERIMIAAVMCTPESLSFMGNMRIDFLKACLKVIRNGYRINEKARKLEKSYIWSRTHYGESIPKKANDFKKEITEHISIKNIKEIENELKKIKNTIKNLKKQKQQIARKYGLSKNLKDIFKVIIQSGEQIDLRKECTIQMTYIIFRVLEHLGKRLKVSANLLGFTTYDELYKWLKYNKKIPLKKLKSRQKLCVYYIELIAQGKTKGYFLSEEDSKKVAKAFFKKTTIVDEFKGSVAAQHNKLIKGKVSLVLNTNKDKFVDGSILVTTMTRPDFLPIMRKAKAIVTDEGGLTCHAAIISRELGIPCIIGTKVGSKILKNGDLVELDTEKGIIRKIK